MRAVEIVREDLKPSDILTRKAFENTIVANSAIGGSTNAPIHINAIAKHIGVKLDITDWEKVGYDIPLLVNMQPAGFYLGEEYYRAGGLPAVMNELLKAGRIHADALTINGKTMGENVKRAKIKNEDVIRTYKKPMKEKAGFKVLHGNLFDSAVMKTSVISEEFRKRYLSNPKDPDAFEGRAVVFEGPEDYHHRIDDPKLKIDENTMLFIRGTGPIGYPGAAEVVNMQPPAALIRKGVMALPCIGDGRQSGTSASPSILNASPEAAAGGGLAILKTGDRVRIDLRKGTADILISKAELAERRARLEKQGGFQISAEPDAVAGNPARHGRSARRGHGAQAGRQISARRAEKRSARQSLKARGSTRGRTFEGQDRGRHRGGTGHRACNRRSDDRRRRQGDRHRSGCVKAQEPEEGENLSARHALDQGGRRARQEDRQGVRRAGHPGQLRRLRAPGQCARMLGAGLGLLLRPQCEVGPPRCCAPLCRRCSRTAAARSSPSPPRSPRSAACRSVTSMARPRRR